MSYGPDSLIPRSALTVGTASTALTALTGAIANTWDIDEGSYGHDGDQVLFHVFKTPTDSIEAALGKVQDTGGRRKVPIVFPYVEGQSTDDLGRKGEMFDIDVLIFGVNYKQQYQLLLEALDDPRPGTLVHPVRGRITVAAEDWVVTHESEKKQAVALRVRFIEHNFDVDYSTISVADSIPSALTLAVSFIGKLASVLATVQSVEFIANNTRNLVAALVSGYQDDYILTLTQLNKTFNPDGSGSIPALNPVVAGQSDEVFNVTTTFNDVFNGSQSINQTQTAESQELTAALATQQAIDRVNQTRALLESAIEQIEATEFGDGALIFFDEILTMQESAISMQSVLELGIQTSKNTVVSYMTPRDMSVREVCFANGLSPDKSYDVEVLNPDLESMNHIPKGTTVQVPT
jgi:hypothetical protein